MTGRRRRYRGGMARDPDELADALDALAAGVEEPEPVAEPAAEPRSPRPLPDERGKLPVAGIRPVAEPARKPRPKPPTAAPTAPATASAPTAPPEQEAWSDVPASSGRAAAPKVSRTVLRRIDRQQTTIPPALVGGGLLMVYGLLWFVLPGGHPLRLSGSPTLAGLCLLLGALLIGLAVLLGIQVDTARRRHGL